MTGNAPPVPLASRPGRDTLQAVQRPSTLVLERRYTFDDSLRLNLVTMLGEGHPLCSQYGESIVSHLSATVMSTLSCGAGADQVEAELRRLGRWLQECHIPASLYTIITRSMLQSIRGAIGDEWSSSLGSHWAAVYVWVVDALVSGTYLDQPSGMAVPSFTTGNTAPAAPAGDQGPPYPAGAHDRAPAAPAANPPAPASRDQAKPRRKGRGGMASFLVANGAVSEKMVDDPLFAAARGATRHLFDDDDDDDE